MAKTTKVDAAINKLYHESMGPFLACDTYKKEFVRWWVMRYTKGTVVQIDWPCGEDSPPVSEVCTTDGLVALENLRNEITAVIGPELKTWAWDAVDGESRRINVKIKKPHDSMATLLVLKFAK